MNRREALAAVRPAWRGGSNMRSASHCTVLSTAIDRRSRLRRSSTSRSSTPTSMGSSHASAEPGTRASWMRTRPRPSQPATPPVGALACASQDQVGAGRRMPIRRSVVAVAWSGALDLPTRLRRSGAATRRLHCRAGTLPTSRPDPRESAHHRRGAGRWSPHGHGSRPICSSVTPRGLGNRRRPRRPCLADHVAIVRSSGTPRPEVEADDAMDADPRDRRVPAMPRASRGSTSLPAAYRSDVRPGRPARRGATLRHRAVQA